MGEGEREEEGNEGGQERGRKINAECGPSPVVV